MTDDDMRVSRSIESHGDAERYVVQYLHPTHTPSVANLREHLGPRSKRAAMHRGDAKTLCLRAKPPALPVVVKLTRHGVRELDDDNLRLALKAIRDGIADAYGVADNDPRIVWEYAQAKAKRREVGVWVRIKGAAG